MTSRKTKKQIKDEKVFPQSLLDHQDVIRQADREEIIERWKQRHGEKPSEKFINDLLDSSL